MFSPKACNYFLVNKSNMNIKCVVLITNREGRSYSSATGSNQDIHKRVICAGELKMKTPITTYIKGTVPRAKKSKNYLTDRCPIVIFLYCALFIVASVTQLIALKCPHR